jgi:hypothetical protein
VEVVYNRTCDFQYDERLEFQHSVACPQVHASREKWVHFDLTRDQIENLEEGREVGREEEAKDEKVSAFLLCTIKFSLMKLSYHTYFSSSVYNSALATTSI